MAPVAYLGGTGSVSPSLPFVALISRGSAVARGGPRGGSGVRGGSGGALVNYETLQ
jgi:hypothetical protein